MHLMLIGGGEIGAPREDGSFRPLETLKIDEYLVQSLHKKEPNLLFVPTATEQIDPLKTYEQGIRNLYGKKLGCVVDVLYLTPNPSKDEIINKLQRADIVYIGGGDTRFMLECWASCGFDECLKKEALSGKMMAGLSAGAMCWFDKVVIKKDNVSSFTDGLGLLRDFCVPHWNKKRELFIKEYIAKNTTFLALDECAALEVKDGNIKVISCLPEAKVYRCEYYDDFKQSEIKKNETISLHNQR